MALTAHEQEVLVKLTPRTNFHAKILMIEDSEWDRCRRQDIEPRAEDPKASSSRNAVCSPQERELRRALKETVIGIGEKTVKWNTVAVMELVGGNVATGIRPPNMVLALAQQL